jgi:hypothetical protein
MSRFVVVAFTVVRQFLSKAGLSRVGTIIEIFGLFELGVFPESWCELMSTIFLSVNSGLKTLARR